MALSKATPRSHQHAEDQRVSAITETSDPRAKINVDEEDAIREAQAANVGHALSLALGPNASKNPRSKLVAPATPWLPARKARCVSDF